MANIRPNQLPPATEITNNDLLILDQGAAGVNAATPKSVLDAFAPIATQEEAEAGQDNEKRMTPLRAQQHLLAQGVPNTRSVIAGDGLTGGGTLEANRTVALSNDSIASLELADSAVQSVNEKTGSSISLTKGDVGLGNVDNTSDANKPISTATQSALDGKANTNIAIEAGTGLAGGGTLAENRNIALNSSSIASLAKADSAVQPNVLESYATLTQLATKFDNPSGSTAQYIRGDGTLATFPSIPSQGVTSVGLTVPAGLSVAGSPVTSTGTLAVTYQSGYQGYTTAESIKLAGIAEGATKNDTDANLKNQANHTGTQAISTVTGLQAALDGKVDNSVTISAGSGLTGGGDLTANRNIALNAASVASLGKADTALQAPGGAAGQILAKSSNADNDVDWVTSEAATAVSYGPQDLTPAQQTQARANIGAFSTSGGTVDGNVRVNGFSEFRSGTNAAQAVPLGLGWENAVNTHWRFILEMNGSLSFSYYNPATGDWLNTPWTVSTAGSQTFYQVPICASTPTDASHLTRKAYVDGIVSPKADTTYVNSQLAGKASTVENIFTGDQEIRKGIPRLSFISSNLNYGYTLGANISDTVGGGFSLRSGWTGPLLWESFSNGSMTVHGSFTASSKSFITDHPLDPENKDLIYVSTESPGHGIEYWGTVRLVNGHATVDVDAHYGMMTGTFKEMTKDAVVFLQNQDSGKLVYCRWNEDGTFEIICDDETCSDLIGWQVKGLRKDIGIYSLSYTDHDTGKHVPEQDKPEYEEIEQ